jgi:PAS domain S-box-containing protein
MLPRAISISAFPPDALFETSGVIVVGGLINLFFHIHRKNIAHRKNAEEVLAKTIDYFPIPLFVINNQHIITQWNTAIERLTDLKKGEMLGTNNQWKAFYKEKRPVLADLLVDGASSDEIATHYQDKSLKSSLIEGAYEVEDFYPTIGQTGQWLHFTAIPVKNSSGGIEGAIETLENITIRKEAEEALRKSEKSARELFENALNAIWVHDLEGNIITANEAAAKLAGYSLEELCKANIKLFLTEESLNLARDIKSKLVQNQPVVLPYEQRLIRKDGTEAICMITTNLITSDGKPQAFQNIAIDVTEEKRLYENLRYYLQEITRAQEEERKRIARELHDSTAQTLIVLLHQLENILADKTKMPFREVKTLWNFREQLRDVLHEVRRFSRDLRPSILDDLGLLPALEWLTDELENEYGIDTNLNIIGNERRLPQEAEILLFRIVQEALRNVAKHAQATKAQVDVKFEENKIRVIVSDNGAGFQLPEKLGALPQIGKLGLVGIQERVQLLGGNLKVESEPGKGTTIIVEAPI